jgi:hypothetical protein
MFFPFVLLFWLVLVVLALAAFVNAVEEAQEKGHQAPAASTPRRHVTPPVRHRHFQVLHHIH